MSGQHLALPQRIPNQPIIAATSFFSFINVDVSSLIYDPTTYISNLTIDKAEFIHRCKQICSMLQFEFYFTKVSQLNPLLSALSPCNP